MYLLLYAVLALLSVPAISFKEGNPCANIGSLIGRGVHVGRGLFGASEVSPLGIRPRCNKIRRSLSYETDISPLTLVQRSLGGGASAHPSVPEAAPVHSESPEITPAHSKSPETAAKTTHQVSNEENSFAILRPNPVNHNHRYVEQQSSSGFNTNTGGLAGEQRVGHKNVAISPHDGVGAHTSKVASLLQPASHKVTPKTPEELELDRILRPNRVRHP